MAKIIYGVPDIVPMHGKKQYSGYQYKSTLVPVVNAVWGYQYSSHGKSSLVGTDMVPMAKAV